MNTLSNMDELDLPDPKIGQVCRNMIAARKKITFRSVAAELGIAHTTLSRNDDCKRQVEKARSLQLLAATIRATERGHINEDESLPLARARLKIQELEAENALLIASHRAMVMAVGELGGMRAWRRFFEAHQASLQKLDELGAIPDSATPLRVADASDVMAGN